MHHPTALLRRTILLIAIAIITTLAGGIIASVTPAHADTSAPPIAVGGTTSTTSSAGASSCPKDLAGYNALPIADRDRCARMVLKKDLTARKQDLVDNGQMSSLSDACPAQDDSWGGDKDTNRILCNGLQVVDDRIARAPDAYLLGIDGQTRLGRAIVAIGDPQTAKNIVVSVPGMTARLGAGFSKDIAHADMFAAASREDTAAIVWLGFDSPQDPWYNDSNGTDAAGPLADFLTGLQKIRRQPVHLTLIGHSYGTVVVGDALTTASLPRSPSSPVDDVIFLGSEGTGNATDAQSLHVNHKAWVCLGNNDLLAGMHPIGPIPSAADFHADRLDCGDVDHTSYWAGDDPDKAVNEPGTKNMLAIINGTYTTTSPPPFSPPPMPTHPIG